MLGAGQKEASGGAQHHLLSCDWIDTQKLAFNNSCDAAEALTEALTGCHLPVEAGDADQVFDFFNGAGRPQGATPTRAKVARLRVTTGCFVPATAIPCAGAGAAGSRGLSTICPWRGATRMSAAHCRGRGVVRPVGRQGE